MGTSEPAAAIPNAAKPRVRAWGLRLTLVAALLAGALVLWSEAAPPNQLWTLPSGEMIEVLSYQTVYDANYRPVTKKVEPRHYLWLQFRSGLTDSEGDRRRVLALAQILCFRADSLGLRRFLVEPARKRFFGLVTYSRPYWFAVDDRECNEVERRRS